jgi:hypothetical protein
MKKILHLENQYLEARIVYLIKSRRVIKSMVSKSQVSSALNSSILMHINWNMKSLVLGIYTWIAQIWIMYLLHYSALHLMITLENPTFLSTYVLVDPATTLCETPS